MYVAKEIISVEGTVWTLLKGAGYYFKYHKRDRLLIQVSKFSSGIEVLREVRDFSTHLNCTV